jgi:hemoglobin
MRPLTGVPVPPDRLDLTSHHDVVRLVDTFYDRVRADDILGPIFNDIAHVDWSTHLPRMYDFWESVLFGASSFKGSPLVVHRELAGRAPLTAEGFDRWVALFHTTIDDLFVGPMADQAKQRAVHIANALQYHLAIDAGAR